MLNAMEDQMISVQVWRIPQERISVNRLSERLEEDVGVYAKDNCAIPTRMGKYIPVQTNCEITGEVLIEIKDKTIPGLVLPEIIYNLKKKLGCIFAENHNLESVMLKRGQTEERASDVMRSATRGARSNTRSRILREKNAVWETETAFETVNIEFPCLKRRIHPNQSLTKL